MDSDYFYFYANINTGRTLFAATLEEQEQHIAEVDEEYAAERAAAGN